MIASDRNTKNANKFLNKSNTLDLQDNSAKKNKGLQYSVNGSTFSKIDIKDSLARKTRVTSGRDKSLRSPKVEGGSSPYRNDNIKTSSMSMIPTNF